MQKEFLHLAYLLTKHECVTLPGLGALVVQSVSRPEKMISGVFPALTSSLSFNAELSHNDGLLVSSIQNEQQVSYNEANLHVSCFVEELRKKLHLQQEIYMSGVGTMKMVEGRITFSPADFLSCNASNYGLVDFHLPLLSELLNVSERLEKEQPVFTPEVVWIPLNKRVFKTVASVAATALLLLTFSTPLRNSQPQVQNAAVINLRNAEAKTAEMIQKSLEESLLGNVEEDNSEILPLGADVSLENVVAEDLVQELPHSYFIVIGSLPSLQTAKDQIKQIRNVFSHADIIGNGERFRIYVESFSDKKAAEDYLELFRKDHPAYKNAWLLSQKN